MIIEKTGNGFDCRRTHERKMYSAEIFYYHTNRSYAGSLKDISLGGAYIETYNVNQFSQEDVVTVNIPFPSGKKIVNRKGRIRWFNNVGFGVEFM